MLESRIKQALTKACKNIVFDEQMSKHSTIKIGGRVLFFASPKSQLEIKRLLSVCKRIGLKVKVVGNCSNILFSDTCAEIGVISTLQLKGIVLDQKAAIIDVMAGELVSTVFATTSKAGLSGFECLAGIPGTIGAGVRGNAGAFGMSFGDVVKEVKVIDASGRVKTIHKSELEFSYRKSNLEEAELTILSVRFALKRLAPSVIISIAKECATKRKLTQPQEPSLGSVFKKFGEISAGMLIDEAGLKNTMIGGCAISAKHANFIVNTGSGTASDYKKLVELVHAVIMARFGIDLEREVEYI